MLKHMRSLRPVCLLFLALVLSAESGDLMKELHFRLIGPFRGGRVVAVAGVPSQPSVYYFGATGGGVWKTTNSGATWAPMTDGQLKTGSVGAIAVADSDPNTIYVGMGEACVRGNASNGDGVYKSIDGGKSWHNVGLEDTYHIGAVRVHPKNPDIVYVAALGHLFGPNEQRGVFRSIDGGKTWKQVLTRGPEAGAVDLAMDPSDPRVLYATFWQVSRKPWRLDSGGPGSGLWKSTDGGDTWSDLSRNPGLPKGVLGRIGVTISPADPERIWAIVEAADGGVFRSDNGGKNWTKVNSQSILRQRAWYYSHIFADPKDADTVYALNVGMYRSIDGGKTYASIRPPHGDNHDLWIDPANPMRMIESNDGGATVSNDGGKSWSTEDNQPTAQFYRVALDEDFPYHVYGAQQDNSTVRIASRTTGFGGITDRDWYDVGGGESGWIAPDPSNSEIVYAGSYGNYLTRQDHRTGQMRNINAWPDNPMGYGAGALKYRFQWSYPIAFSPHDAKTLYIGSNVLMKTVNEGQNWEVISPDLTRNDPSKELSSGGPITQDNTSVEYYDTIFTFAESSLTKGLIWVGTDDGLVQVTRDGGKHWENVTPQGMPEWIQINSVDPSPFDAGTCYVAATAYKLDDFRPYLYKTSDYGKTWKKIINGIPERDFTRVVKADPNRKGLLVAGTEFGLFLSQDDGENWKSFQLNLPIVPITDVAFHKRERELVVATQGRAFYVLDDLPLLYQFDDSVSGEGVHLFQPKDAYRVGGGRGFGGRRGPATVGENPPAGAQIAYLLKEKPAGEVKIEILDAAGKLVNTYSSKPVERPHATDGEEEGGEENPFRSAPPPPVPAAVGMNHYVWNLRYPDATTFPGLIMWAGDVTGPVAAPGSYTVRLTVDGKSQAQTFMLKKDPRLATTAEDYASQLSLALQLRDKLSQTNQAVIRIRAVRRQLDQYTGRADKRIAEAAKSLEDKLTAIEQDLYQTKNRASEDPLNYPIKLNNKIAYVMGEVESSDNRPTTQSNLVFEELATQVNARLASLDGLLSKDLAAFNQLVHDANAPAVEAPAKSTDDARK